MPTVDELTRNGPLECASGMPADLTRCGPTLIVSRETICSDCRRPSWYTGLDLQLAEPLGCRYQRSKSKCSTWNISANCTVSLVGVAWNLRSNCFTRNNLHIHVEFCYISH